MIQIVCWKIQVQGALGWADVKIRPSPGERFATLEFSTRGGGRPSETSQPVGLLAGKS